MQIFVFLNGMVDQSELRSKQISAGDGQGHIDWLRCSLMQPMGFTREEFDRPLVGIANCWNEVLPGVYHHRELAQRIKDGIREAGGTPLEFNTIALCDGLTQGHRGMKYVLPSRDIIAASIESTVEANQLDAVVGLGTCDKIIPGMLMGLARLDLPSVMVTGGYMTPGTYEGEKLLVSDITKRYERMTEGDISEEEYAEMVETCCQSPGACAGMWTANTMAVLSEALGMSVAGNGVTAATKTTVRQKAYESGKVIMELLEADVRASDVLTEAAFENAIKVFMAVGGSTNAVLHFPAIAREVGLDLGTDIYNECAEDVPTICGVDPISDYTLDDLDEVGGVPAVMREIQDHLDLSVRTVEADTLGDRLDDAPTRPSDSDVLRSVDDPYFEQGGTVILSGNLAPGGAVIKQSAVDEVMLNHEGPARVFDSEEDAVEAFVSDEIDPGDVVVIRYEGPKGGPGMREMYDILQMVDGAGLSDSVPVVTDGRYSGSNRGGAIGHVSPEAIEGGPIALVEDGDRITIDIPDRTLSVDVSEDEFENRRSDWDPEEPEETGFLSIYSRLAASPMEGGYIS
ncbi:MAG: dihydroxy-acid dehydratase [Halodesulfurarchaeum sp.]